MQICPFRGASQTTTSQFPTLQQQIYISERNFTLTDKFKNKNWSKYRENKLKIPAFGSVLCFVMQDAIHS